MIEQSEIRPTILQPGRPSNEDMIGWLISWKREFPQAREFSVIGYGGTLWIELAEHLPAGPVSVRKCISDDELQAAVDPGAILAELAKSAIEEIRWGWISTGTINAVSLGTAQLCGNDEHKEESK